MAIARDAVTANQSTTGTSLTFAHTTSGSNRLLWVGVRSGVNEDFITGVTYGGQAMTFVRKRQAQAGDLRWVYLFVLINPPSGTNNVVVSASGSTSINASAVSYTGVRQTSQPPQSNDGYHDTSLTLGVTTTDDNCWLVGFFRSTGSVASAGAGTTELGGSLFNSPMDSNGAKTPAGSHSLVVNGSSVTGVMMSIAPWIGDPPTVTTQTPADDITSNSATGGGNVTSDGGATITERGIVWGTSPNPTTAGNKQTTSGTTGSFTDVPMTGLLPNTHYYYRAYAINAQGTSYGSNVEFDTLDAVISGNCVLEGNPVENAKITLIDSDTDDIVDTALSDSSGDYAFSGLDVTKTYHVVAEYEDSPDQFNTKSLPFMTPEEV